MSMCLCAHLHEIARRSGVVCRAIALLSQVERGAKVLCMLLLQGASTPCVARIALVVAAQRAWLPPEKVLDAVEIEGQREAQRLV